MLQHPDMPTQPWQVITVDFVTKLPVSTTLYDMILVVTDKFTKYIHLVPTSETIDAADMAYLFLEHVVAHHGVPETIISD